MCLSRPYSVQIFKGCLHKFHLVHSWILCPISVSKNLMKYCISYQSILKGWGSNQIYKPSEENQIYPKVAIVLSGMIVWSDVRNDSLIVNKIRNISRRYITACYWILEFRIRNRMVYLKLQIQIHMKIWTRNLDKLIFKLKCQEKHLDLQFYQQLCSMTSI